MIVGDNWGRRHIFRRLVYWNLVHYMILHRVFIRRVHTVVNWGLIDMNRLPMVGRNWRVGSGGYQRWSRGDDEGSECSRGRVSRSWMGGGGWKVVRHRGGDVVEVVVVNRGRQCLHLLIRRLVRWLWWYIRSWRGLMFIRRWRIIGCWSFIMGRWLMVNWWGVLLMVSWWLMMVICNWGLIRSWGLIWSWGLI